MIDLKFQIFLNTWRLFHLFAYLDAAGDRIQGLRAGKCSVERSLKAVKDAVSLDYC